MAVCVSLAQDQEGNGHFLQPHPTTLLFLPALHNWAIKEVTPGTDSGLQDLIQVLRVGVLLCALGSRAPQTAAPELWRHWVWRKGA